MWPFRKKETTSDKRVLASAVSTMRVSRSNSSWSNRLHHSAMQRPEWALVSDSRQGQKRPFLSGRNEHGQYPSRPPEGPGDASET